MVKIIGGKRYDTNTAKEIGNASYNGSVTDFQWWDETLYLKRTGEFFPLRRRVGLQASTVDQQGRIVGAEGKKKIIPLTIKEAKEWAEKYLDGDEVRSTV